MVQPINKHVRKLSCDLFFSAHTQTQSSQSPRLSLSDKCQPPSSWTDIDGYLGLFLQSVVHLRTEMESISAWLAARVTVGQSNLAGWHPLESLCLSCWAISALFPKFTSHKQALTKTPQISSQIRINWSKAEGNKVQTFGEVVKFDLAFANNLSRYNKTKRTYNTNILLFICHFNLKVYIKL